MMTVREAEGVARTAHVGQVDKLGVPYICHVQAVADGLVPLGVDEVTIAGLLHDVLEDTAWTAQDLLNAGVPARSVEIVVKVTRVPGIPYQDMIRSILDDPGAVLVKIADNAHNSRPDRLAGLDEKTRAHLVLKYTKARKVLWAAAYPADVQAIIAVVNSRLFNELHDIKLN